MRLLPFLPKVLAAAAIALPAAATPDLPAAERQVLEASNAFRREHSLPALRPEAQLDRAAGRFARFMAERDAFGHEADGRTPADRARAAGYRDCMVAENIAQQYSSADFRTGELADRFVKGWIASPGHRRNLLDAEAVEVGVAIARSDRSGRYYAVQLFGRPESMRVGFEVRNESQSPVRYRVGDREFTLAARTERSHQVCSDARVAFPGRGGERSHQPATGDRYTITPGGALRLPPRRANG